MKNLWTANFPNCCKNCNFVVVAAVSVVAVEAAEVGDGSAAVHIRGLIAVVLAAAGYSADQRILVEPVAVLDFQNGGLMSGTKVDSDGDQMSDWHADDYYAGCNAGWAAADCSVVQPEYLAHGSQFGHSAVGIDSGYTDAGCTEIDCNVEADHRLAAHQSY